ncbi:hypothetical protein PANDA_017936 [Ailuropoda melanoleuca]|uniref:Alcohol dehydrogenase-like C-terminal domain-containing protein n=1 Tax=Ailuropoda melanoleuca TaxID=9646 RepID=D2HYU7_AILME|nr:hypothetical protein PANDA_017936 [Ailuropoda melanoleuca]
MESLCLANVKLLPYCEKPASDSFLGHGVRAEENFLTLPAQSHTAAGKATALRLKKGLATLPLLGDKVIPLFLPPCRECNAFSTWMATLALGHYWSWSPADGPTRYTCKGKPVCHYVNTSVFTEYTLVDESSVAKTDDATPESRFNGCGFSTGHGSAVKMSKVTLWFNFCCLWPGRGSLSVIMDCKLAGAPRFLGIDLNKDKFEKAMAVGATKCINPRDSTKPMGEFHEVIKHGEHLIIQSLSSNCNKGQMKKAAYFPTLDVYFRGSNSPWLPDFHRGGQACSSGVGALDNVYRINILPSCPLVLANSCSAISVQVSLHSSRMSPLTLVPLRSLSNLAGLRTGKSQPKILCLLETPNPEMLDQLCNLHKAHPATCVLHNLGTALRIREDV